MYVTAHLQVQWKDHRCVSGIQRYLLWSSGAKSYESSRQVFALLLVGVVSLSIFGGSFVLAKVCRGLISVRCSELRGVRFLEVRNVLVLW